MALFNVRGGAGDITKPDLNARPQDNLYLAVNSEWIEKAKIPSDRSRISSFDGIDLNIEKSLMQDFADFADGKKKLPEVLILKRQLNFIRSLIISIKETKMVRSQLRLTLKKLLVCAT